MLRLSAVLMKLYCVGCGPGDPELLTVRAANLIKSAEVIFAPTAREGKPSIALSVVEKYIDKSTKTASLVFPMVKDKESLKDYWKRNAAEIAEAVKTGKKVVYLTVGDPALYSTWIYIHRQLRWDHPDVEIETGAVFEEHVRRSTPGHHPAEEVPGHLVRAETSLTAQCAGDAVFVLEPEDPAVHEIRLNPISGSTRMQSSQGPDDGRRDARCHRPERRLPSLPTRVPRRV